MVLICTNPSLCNGEAGAFCKKALLARSFCCLTFFGPKNTKFSCFTCLVFLLHMSSFLASPAHLSCFTSSGMLLLLPACMFFVVFTFSNILLHMLSHLASHALKSCFTWADVFLHMLSCLIVSALLSALLCSDSNVSLWMPMVLSSHYLIAPRGLFICPGFFLPTPCLILALKCSIVLVVRSALVVNIRCCSKRGQS